MVELDQMKTELLSYKTPLAEVKDSLDLDNKAKRVEWRLPAFGIIRTVPMLK